MQNKTTLQILKTKKSFFSSESCQTVLNYLKLSGIPPGFLPLSWVCWLNKQWGPEYCTSKVYKRLKAVQLWKAQKNGI